MLVTGSIDETIVERQVGKQELLEMLASKKLPAEKLEDRHLLFALDGEETSSRLSARLSSLPECPYASAPFETLDPDESADAASLAEFPPLQNLVAASLREPDVGRERLAWHVGTSGTEVPREGSGATEDARGEVRLLSYAFHQETTLGGRLAEEGGGDGEGGSDGDGDEMDTSV